MAEKHDNAKSAAIARRDAMREAARSSAPAARTSPQRSGVAWEPARKPQVFIAYSQHDRAVAEALASYLEGVGIEAWSDRKIKSGQNFSLAIETALELVQAVIVIWSDTAVKSEFVLNEANFALDPDKLITVHVQGFDKRKIPIGFRLRQSEGVEDRERLIQSLGRFGVHPDAAPARKRAGAS